MDIHTFEWGTDVYCGDDACANLSRLVVDPETAVVSDLVVEQGLLLKKAWVVPRRHVQKADRDGVWLALAEDELTASQPYKRRVIEEVAEGYEGGSIGVSPSNLGMPDMGAVPTISRVVHDGVASPDLRVLDQDVEVRDLVEEMTVGRLKQVLVDAESGEIVQLEVNSGLLGEDVTLQPSVVVHYDEDRILVQNATSSGSEKKPQSVAAPRAQAERKKDNIDESSTANLPLYTRIELAFHDDSRTRDEVIEVVEQQGVVTLVGEVSNADASRVAEEVARSQSGVIAVHNNLHVRP